MYSLSREEREEVRVFVKEQLRKGYIRSSKLPQTAPVFFVRKKDGKKRMVQDYRYFNEWMVKNNYTLPLILNVIENIGTKKVFIKIDLRCVKFTNGGLSFFLFYFSFRFIFLFFYF